MNLRIVRVLFIIFIGPMAVSAGDDAEIVLTCSGTTSNGHLDPDRARAPLNINDLSIHLSSCTRTATLSSITEGRFVMREYPVIQWDALLIVFQNSDAFGFVMRDTGNVSINAAIGGNPGPAVFQLACKPVKTMF